MANLSTFLKNGLIQHVFRTGSFTKPSALYIALYVGVSEVSGGSYARVAYGPGDAFWAAPTGDNGVTSNLAEILFPAASANWGSVTGFKVMDASSGGTVLIQGSFASPKSINSGDPAARFPIGTLIGTFS